MKEISIFELEEGKEYKNEDAYNHMIFKRCNNKFYIKHEDEPDSGYTERNGAYISGYTEVQPEPKMVKWYKYDYSRPHSWDRDIFDYFEIYTIVSKKDWGILNFAKIYTLLSTLTLDAPETATIKEVYEMFKKMEAEK